jgi:hypothetical protein
MLQRRGGGAQLKRLAWLAFRNKVELILLAAGWLEEDYIFVLKR